MDKVGCNHLIIAGLLESVDYAKADFLAMHLEQHLQFTIDRQGKLKSQWDDYYNSVLVPLEITSDAIKDGETVVYTREGRIIGNFQDFADWVLQKYNILIEYDEERMKAISDVHTSRAKQEIEDKQTDEFNAKVEVVLNDRAKELKRMNKELDSHKSVCSIVNASIKELDDLITFIQPQLDVLYALHHYPVKEEVEESSEAQDTEGEENSTEGGETDTDAAETAPTEEDESKPPEPEPEPEPQPTEPEPEHETETEETTDQSDSQTKDGEEEDKKEEKNKEEEEEGEPDPEAVEAQTKMQESFKFPTLERSVETVNKMKDAEIDLEDFVTELNEIMTKCTDIIKAEKFKWKVLEKEMLALKDKINVAANMLRITIISSEELQMKALETEIDNYDNFIIPDIDHDVLDAAAIKFAATFAFA